MGQDIAVRLYKLHEWSCPREKSSVTVTLGGGRYSAAAVAADLTENREIYIGLPHL